MGASTAGGIRPVTDDDLPAVAAFLSANLNQRVSPEAWIRAVRVPWAVDAPNHGFLLEADGEVVGAYLAYYSERSVEGRTVRFCNLGAWCVLEAHRFRGLALLKALLAQDGYTFTDLSPSGSVIPLNRRLGVEELDTTTSLVPNLPWLPLPNPGRVSADPAELAATLKGRELEIYRDHADAAAARHLVLTHGDRWCYVIFRRDRRKGLPGFASVLHVSDPDLFGRMAHRVSRHMLLRHGVLVALVERRIGGVPRWPRFRLRSPRTKMFKSADLSPDKIDDLYSELVCLPW
ncbi:MAG: hypothetical protein AB7L84_05275 [Acidimicrobiia bacterium]